VPVPRFALGVLLATLVGFGLSTRLGIAPVWIAAAGALALSAYARVPPQRALAAAQPLFLLFVLALGVVVRAASQHGLASLVDDLIPHGHTLPMLLAIAAVSAVIANLVNNLPATLIVLPVVATGGPPPVLAMLIGVGVGPNLTYVGSLATLLWRQVMHAQGQRTDIRAFARLGLLVAPGALCGATLALWLALKVV
jgi:arsenical pump membrane protein